jgi:hypothetical protein
LACEYNLPKLDKVDEDFIFRRLWPEEGGDDEDDEVVSPAVEGREGGDEAYREEEEDGVICDGVATVFPIKLIGFLVKDGELKKGEERGKGKKKKVRRKKKGFFCLCHSQQTSLFLFWQ